MNKTNKLTKQKDLNVELIRIIAMFMVIVYHVRPFAIISKGNIDPIFLFIENIVVNANAIFFIIGGFFMFKNTNNEFMTWMQKIVNYILNRILPMAFLAMIFIIFDDCIIGKTTMIECVKNVNLISIIKNMTYGSSTALGSYFGHAGPQFWFILFYFRIILIYPIYMLLVKQKTRTICFILEIFLFYQICVNFIAIFWDKVSFWNLTFLHFYLGYVLWGYLLYNVFLKRKKWINMYMSLILSLIFFIISYMAQYYHMLSYDAVTDLKFNANQYEIATSFLTSFFFISFMLQLDLSKCLSYRLRKIILFLGKYSFGIYCFHYLAIHILDNIGIHQYFQIIIFNNRLYLPIWIVVYCGLVLIISLVFSYFYKMICDILSKIIKKYIWSLVNAMR